MIMPYRCYGNYCLSNNLIGHMYNCPNIVQQIQGNSNVMKISLLRIGILITIWGYLYYIMFHSPPLDEQKISRGHSSEADVQGGKNEDKRL